MSTRWFVGTIDEAGLFHAPGHLRGRYVHSDGYPAWAGRVLTELVAKFDGGLDQLLTVLMTDHYGWSQLDPRTGAKDESYLGERGVNVEGIGVAYTTALGQSSPEDWIEGVLGSGYTEGDWGTEFGYVFTSADPGTAELVVVRVSGEEPTFREFGRVPVREMHRVDWANVELAGMPLGVHRP